MGEVTILLDLGRLLGPLPLDLELTASLDGSLHLGFPLLLLLVESIRSVFGLGNLPVQHLFLVVPQGAQLFDLPVDHALASLLLISKSLLFSLLLHSFEGLTLLGKCLNLLLLFNFLESLSLLNLQQLIVCVGEVRAHLSDLLLTRDLTLLFALKIFLSLSLDKLTF